MALGLRVRNNRLERRQRALIERWEPAVLDVLAGAADDSALLDLVTPSDESFFLSFLLGYARRLHGEERDTVKRLAKPFLPRLAAGAREGSAEERGQTMQVLAGLGLPDHADTVAAALEDRSPVVAMIAAHGLYRRGYEAYFPLVLRHLPRFTLWSRSFLASMLTRGGPASAPPLRDTLADPARPPLVRAVAADALTLLNDIESVAVAAKILEDPEQRDRELLVASIRLVRRLGHQNHTRLLRPLVSIPDPVIRAAAVGALGALGGPEDVPTLQDALDDEAYWVSLEAARGLLALGAGDELEHLGASSSPWAALARQVLSE